MEITAKDLAAKCIDSVLVIKGPSQSGKTVAAMDLLDEIINLNSINRLKCWAPEYSIDSNGYKFNFC